MIRLALDLDAAIIDLRPYAERQRATNAIERLRTEGTFLTLDLSNPTEEQLWQIADPIEAHRQGVASYASVPIRDEDDMLLGHVTVIASDGRTFEAQAMQTMRAAAELVAALLC